MLAQMYKSWEWKMETKREMSMIHAVECGTNTVISLQRREVDQGKNGRKEAQLLYFRKHNLTGHDHRPCD